MGVSAGYYSLGWLQSILLKQDKQQCSVEHGVCRTLSNPFAVDRIYNNFILFDVQSQIFVDLPAPEGWKAELT